MRPTRIKQTSRGYHLQQRVLGFLWVNVFTSPFTNLELAMKHASHRKIAGELKIVYNKRTDS